MFRVYNLTDCETCNPFQCQITNVDLKISCMILFDCIGSTTTEPTSTTTIKPAAPTSTSSYIIIISILIAIIVFVGCFIKKKISRPVNHPSEERILMSEINY